MSASVQATPRTTTTPVWVHEREHRTDCFRRADKQIYLVLILSRVVALNFMLLPFLQGNGHLFLAWVSLRFRFSAGEMHESFDDGIQSPAAAAGGGVFYLIFWVDTFIVQ